jgi:tetratricopeptide (TPR) repeat protein
VSEAPDILHDALRDVRTLIRAAHARLRAGELEAAEVLCREALAVEPHRADVLNVLGAVLHATGRAGEALEVFDELTRLEPEEPRHWSNLGTIRRELGRYDQALTAYMRATELGAHDADFYFNVGLTHLDRHDYEAARAVLKRAMQLAPRDAAIRFEYAKACYESLQMEEAAEALSDWQQLDGMNTALLAGIGHSLMNLGETGAAEQAMRQVAEAGQAHPRASLTLAQIFERTNRVEEASAILAGLGKHAAELGTDLTGAQAQLAQRGGEHEKAIGLFQRCLDSQSDFHTRHIELFAIARSQDALGRYDEAFATLQEAHRSQVEHFKLTAPAATARGGATMSITQYGCDAEDVRGWSDDRAPSSAESPIFIVAFPRSGTTLLELTLDAHPALVSMDEQPFVQGALDDLLAIGARYPECMAGLNAGQLDDVRQRYWARAARKAKREVGQRLVDKNPLNLMRLPVIRRVFPNARIILAVRDPRDVLLSCYMQHFRAPDFALLCRSLETLAAGYRRAFDFWHEQAKLLQPAVREVRYETFVADFERETRELLEFLEVPWHDATLQPARRARAKGYISTPSYSQVVQPVNGRSVGRWKSYARHLEPALPLIEPYL